MKKIRLKYIAIFDVASDGISITFPDIPECLSCAYSKRQSKKMAKDALELALHEVKLSELPTNKYPIKRFTSRKLFVRTVVVKMYVKGDSLFSKKVREGEE